MIPGLKPYQLLRSIPNNQLTLELTQYIIRTRVACAFWPKFELGTQLMFLFKKSFLVIELNWISIDKNHSKFNISTHTLSLNIFQIVFIKILFIEGSPTIYTKKNNGELGHTLGRKCALTRHYTFAFDRLECDPNIVHYPHNHRSRPYYPQEPSLTQGKPGLGRLAQGS